MTRYNDRYNVVLLTPDGTILDVESYDPGKRPRSITEACARLAARRGISAPLEPRGAVDALGNEWGRMPGDLQPGMVEIGWGRWGFPPVILDA